MRAITSAWSRWRSRSVTIHTDWSREGKPRAFSAKNDTKLPKLRDRESSSSGECSSRKASPRGYAHVAACAAGCDDQRVRALSAVGVVQPGELLERRAELSSLEACLEAVGGSAGRLALVYGEAGVGKTALLRHFCAQLPPGCVCCRRPVTPCPPRVPWGRCLTSRVSRAASCACGLSVRPARQT